MTTKQRAYLKGLAMTMDPIFQIGKASMNPGLTQAVSEARWVPPSMVLMLLTYEWIFSE